MAQPKRQLEQRRDEIAREIARLAIKRLELQDAEMTDAVAAEIMIVDNQLRAFTERFQEVEGMIALLEKPEKTPAQS